MRAKNRAPGQKRDEDSNPEGRKKPKTKGFHEGISEMRSEVIAAEMARRRAARDAEARASEEEVARMTFGPSYKPDG